MYSIGWRWVVNRILTPISSHFGILRGLFTGSELKQDRVQTAIGGTFVRLIRGVNAIETSIFPSIPIEAIADADAATICSHGSYRRRMKPSLDQE